jgi:hypothetical protein
MDRIASSLSLFSLDRPLKVIMRLTPRQNPFLDLVVMKSQQLKIDQIRASISPSTSRQSLEDEVRSFLNVSHFRKHFVDVDFCLASNVERNPLLSEPSLVCDSFLSFYIS